MPFYWALVICVYGSDDVFKLFSRVVDRAERGYVATRWYTTLELLVASKKYTLGVDMWNLGCILGEMIRGKPLFPGSCSVNQLERIVAALPNITEDDVKSFGAGFGSVLLSKSNSKLKFPNLDKVLIGSPEDARQLVKSSFKI